MGRRARRRPEPVSFSVVILSANAANLVACVQSVLANEPDLPPDRLIVVDDGARADAESRLPAVAELRERCLRLGNDLPWVDRGAVLALLGSVERAFYLIERIDAERRSVLRVVPSTATTPKRSADNVPDALPAPA